MVVRAYYSSRDLRSMVSSRDDDTPAFAVVHPLHEGHDTCAVGFLNPGSESGELSLRAP